MKPSRFCNPMVEDGFGKNFVLSGRSTYLVSVRTKLLVTCAHRANISHSKLKRNIKIKLKQFNDA